MTSAVVAAIVEWGLLLKVIVVALVGGVGLTIAFSIAVAGAISFVDFRRDGRPLEAGAFALVALVALAACVVAIGFGIAVMIAR